MIVIVIVIVIVIMLGGLLGLLRTTAGDALTTGLGGGTAATDATAGSLALTDAGEFVGRVAAHDHRDVAGALADASGAAPGTGTETLEGRALIGETGRDVEFIGRDRVVVLGVGDG